MVAQRQFDVWSLRDDRGVDLAVILQADALAETATVIVAPLVPVKGRDRIGAATPLVELDGSAFIVPMHLLMTVHRRRLGAKVGTLADAEAKLKAAIDTVFFGI